MWPSTPAERRHLACRCRTCCLRRYRASRPPQNSSFRGSIPHPIRSLCTLRTRHSRRLRNTRFPAARYHLTGADLSPAETRQLRLTHRNRKFESISLQQRVCLSPASAFEGREPRLSARVWTAGLATRSAETRRAFQFAPTCGNISVGPYSSTAVPLMWSARIRRRSQRSRAFRGLMCGRSLNSDPAQAKPSTVR